MLLLLKLRILLQLTSPALPLCTEPMPVAGIGGAGGDMSDLKIPNSRDIPFHHLKYLYLSIITVYLLAY